MQRRLQLIFAASSVLSNSAALICTVSMFKKIPYDLRLLFFLAAWWSGWVLVARLGGTFNISDNTVWLVLSCVVAMMFGGVVAHYAFPRRNSANGVTKAAIIRGSRGWEWFPPATIAVQGILLGLSIRGFLIFGAQFRDLVYEAPQVIWGSSIVIYLYDLFLMPAVLFFYSTRLVRSGLSRRDVVVLFFIYFLDASIKLGRGSFYFFMFFMVAGSLIGKIKLSVPKFSGFMVAMLIISSVFNSVRYGGAFQDVFDQDIGEYLIQSVFNYHTAGFAILDRFVSKEVVFETSSFPVMWLGFLEGFASSILKAMGLADRGTYAMFGAFLQSVIVYTENGYYIAFGTNILPYYIDGGFVFSVLAFFLAGVLICWPVREAAQPVGRFSLIVWMVMVFGIFQPIITGPILFVAGALIFIERVSINAFYGRRGLQHS